MTGLYTHDIAALTAAAPVYALPGTVALYDRKVPEYLPG